MFTVRSIIGGVGGRPPCDKCGCRVRIAHNIASRLWRQFQTTGNTIRGFTVVVVHENWPPQMTGFSLSSDSHRIVIWRVAGKPQSSPNIWKRDRGMEVTVFSFVRHHAS
ncbi:hypothetical protein TNCV_3569331 [Trichonephila clavipes]|nr:hypothetical protein TNCV_3569331 [Trichonephila clavipes]